jgi:hypothetical protein
MNERTCQKLLGVLWLAGGVLILLIMIAQDSRHVYGDQSDTAWTWFKTTIVPTLSLIVGALVYGSRGKTSSRARVDSTAFYVTLGLSAIYLLLAVSAVLLGGVVGLSPIESIIGSNRWLPLIQGVVSLALGGFFVARTAS